MKKEDYSNQYLGERRRGHIAWQKHGEWVDVDTDRDDVVVIRDRKSDSEVAYEIRRGQSAEQIKTWYLA